MLRRGSPRPRPAIWSVGPGRHQWARTALVTAAAAALALVGACRPDQDVLTFSGSVLGSEGAIVRQQIDRFAAEHPDLTIDVQPTPDSADERHQLYVQWLNAWSPDPDILQLDVIWTPEFAAAGWIRPLSADVDTDDFFSAPLAANRWNGQLYAVPWFVDVGMLYWRTDLVPSPPATFAALDAAARSSLDEGAADYGLVWQGARYEGLVTVFLEYLTGFGGRILDDDGRVVVDSPAAERALTAMHDQLARGVVPSAALTWREEPTRFAFQSGRAVFMRNWPYAAALMNDASQSEVAGRFGVAPMPHGEGGLSAAALGGAQLAINAYSRQPEEAWQLIQFLTAPEQMLERAAVAGQYPARRGVYDDPRLAEALAVPPADARRVIEQAVPRPATPVYTQLSGLLQVHLHRALTDQERPADALSAAADEMRAVLGRSGLLPR